MQLATTSGLATVRVHVGALHIRYVSSAAVMTTQSERSERTAAARRRAVFIVFAVFAGLGIVAGLLWPHLVTKVEMVMTEIGPYPLSEETAGQLMAMDAWFAALAAGAALVAGAILASFYLQYDTATVLALLGASTLAAVLALVVGSLSGSGELLLAWDPKVPVETRLTAPLMLHAYGVLLVWPIAALAPVLPLAWLGWTEGNPAGGVTVPSLEQGNNP